MESNNKEERLSYHNLKVKSVWGADTEIKQHISKAVLGTPGKMRYGHTGMLEKIDRVGETLFLTLYKGARLLGTVGLVHRLVRVEERIYNAFFIRYFAIFPPMRSKKHRPRKRKAEGDKSFIMKDMIKEEAERMDSFLVDPEHKKHKTFSYAFIEKENERSLDFSEMIGYRTLGFVHTLLFSRFSPKMDVNVRYLKENEREEMAARIEELYRDHNMYFTDYLPLDEDYYVYEKEGEIIAGLQAYSSSWEIFEMPGFSGWLLLRVFPRIAFLKKIFNARELNYVTFEGIWFKPGHEKILSRLFESVCARSGVFLGVSWFDTRSNIYKKLKRSVRFGLLATIQGSPPSYIRFKSFKLTQAEEEEFDNKPVYVSAYDMT